MIIQLLFDGVMALLSLLLLPIPNIPPLPESISGLLDSFVSYITAGLGIIANFIYVDIFGVLVNLSLACFALYEVYALVLWVLRKIPAAGIE